MIRYRHSCGMVIAFEYEYELASKIKSNSTGVSCCGGSIRGGDLVRIADGSAALTLRQHRCGKFMLWSERHAARETAICNACSMRVCTGDLSSPVVSDKLLCLCRERLSMDAVLSDTVRCPSCEGEMFHREIVEEG